MRRKELYALLATAVILVMVLFAAVLLGDVGYLADDVEPEFHTLKEEGGEDVQEPPPSATGDITEP